MFVKLKIQNNCLKKKGTLITERISNTNTSDSNTRSLILNFKYFPRTKFCNPYFLQKEQQLRKKKQ